MDYVGTYSFSNTSSTLPAISVATPNTRIQGLANVSGLEVIIHDVGKFSRLDYLTSPSDILVTYQIFLILWENGTGNDLMNASKIIGSSFSNAKIIQTVPVLNTENILVQSIVEVPNEALILVNY
jgi:hypothetical protein